MPKFAKKTQGFTLIEVSMVLIIIGLISATIILSRDLIQTAQVRNQIGQIESFNAAVQTFRDQYNCLPGDCINAVELSLGKAGEDGDNGNGNNTYEVLDNGLVEMQNLWIHLANAGLINGRYTAGLMPGINSPALVLEGEGTTERPDIENPKGGVWLVSGKQFLRGTGPSGPVGGPPANFKNGWILTTRAVAGDTFTSGVYTPRLTYRIDAKIDDGAPDSGLIMNIGSDSRLTGGFCNASGTLCVNSHTVEFLGPVSTGQQCCCAYVDGFVGKITYNIEATGPLDAQNPNGYLLCNPTFRTPF